MSDAPALKAPVFPPAVFLMGPTATGKTMLAVELAERFSMEIVSVDSALVYRGMDIGTAKPGPEILSRVPHHLIDLIEPDENYSAGRFRDDALVAMREITERGRIPLLAGGTMLYFKALTDGLNELPQADPAVRLVIDTMAEEQGWPALHTQLAKVDPVTAARLQPNDAQRIQRALEVFYVSGEPMSKLLQKPRYVYFPYRAIRIGLVPGDRALLRERIEHRFEDMLELGLIGEVARLRREYALTLSMSSMRCVGYRQTWKYLDGEYSLTMLRERGVVATRQLAKRQLTWMKAMKGVTTFDCFAGDLLQQVSAFVARQLGEG